MSIEVSLLVLATHIVIENSNLMFEWRLLKRLMRLDQSEECEHEATYFHQVTIFRLSELDYMTALDQPKEVSKSAICREASEMTSMEINPRVRSYTQQINEK